MLTKVRKLGILIEISQKVEPVPDGERPRMYLGHYRESGVLWQWWVPCTAWGAHPFDQIERGLPGPRTLWLRAQDAERTVVVYRALSKLLSEDVTLTVITFIALLE